MTETVEKDWLIQMREQMEALKRAGSTGHEHEAGLASSRAALDHLRERIVEIAEEREEAKADLDKAQIRIEYLEGDRAQLQKKVHNASRMCEAARSVANVAEDKADNLEAMVERLEKQDEQWIEAAHNFKVYRDELWAERDGAKAEIDRLKAELATAEQRWEAEHDRAKLREYWLSDGQTTRIDNMIVERAEARHWACKMLTGRNEARKERDTIQQLAEDANDLAGEALVWLEKALEPSAKVDAGSWLFGMRLRQRLLALAEERNND